MRLLVLLLAATQVCAGDDEGRARKPIVVDAVGNTLPPPSNLPATVGSPVNLLTPDRYEFYTFDESGELVKKLMTLEEIQAIVAAGEEAEGLVTLASDQPTMPFNITQPSSNKVHSVVTNVQNVLKAQMEAHKNNPMLKPTLDTPDVSDSWSLILPSIFGNTGLDIVPDKIPTNITPPETDTLEFKPEIYTDDSLSKEGNNEISSVTQTQDESSKHEATTTKLPFVEEIRTTTTTTSTTTTTTTTTPRPTTTTTPSTTTTTTTTPAPTTTTTTTTTTPPPSTTTSTTPPPTTSTPPPAPPTTKATSTTTTTTTSKPITKAPSTPKPFTTRSPTKSTTVKPYFIKITTLKGNQTKTTTTVKPPPTKFISLKPSSTTTKQVTSTTPLITTKKLPLTTTSRPVDTTTVKLRTTSTTQAPTTKTIIKNTPKITTSRPPTTAKIQPTQTTPKDVESNFNKINLIPNESVTEKNTANIVKNNTFIPISTVTYITERTTQKQPPAKATTVSSTTKKTLITSTDSSTATSQKQPQVTTYKPATSTIKDISTTTQNIDLEKLNTTTITTQSVSPSTTISSTEVISLANKHDLNSKPEDQSNDNKEMILPLFDVAQSISQIASDLGGNYMPIPTVSNIPETTKINGIDLESKENIEIDILPDNDINLSKPNVTESNGDNFVKISTLDPHDTFINKFGDEKETTKTANVVQSVTTETNIATASTFESTTIDRIMSESMGDLLFQVVNQVPQSIVDTEFSTESKDIVTEKNIESTTSLNLSNDIPSASETPSKHSEKLEKEKIANDIPIIENRIAEEKITPDFVSTTVVPSNTNKLGVTEKNPIKEDTQNYVKIGVPNEKNETKESISENINIQTTSSLSNDLGNLQETTKDKEILQDTNNITEHSKTESTTANISSGEIKNNVKTNENNKTLNDISNNIKINSKQPSDDIPKIDEFKKKIQKVNIDDKELANERNNSWKLISTVTPPKSNEVTKDKLKNPGDINSNKDIVLEFSKENQGLEVTTKDLEEDISKFTELCNELAFRYWSTIVEDIDKRRSFVLSPYAITSMLAMMFMGARGATSGEMNDILKLDDMVTFNPHFTLKNVSDSIETTPESGVAVSAFIRELYSDKTKGKILTFYKERAQQFYNGHVEEINFKLVSDIIRRRTNLLVKRYTWGKIAEYMKANTITISPPLAAFSTNIFQTDCTGSSVEGRDGEMYFVVSPNVRQRRLVPVPAVVYKSGFLAGYDPVLDATAAALGNTNSIVSTLFVMPGQQGNVVHGEDLEALEQRLLDANPTAPAWNRLLRTLLPRIGLELQIPRFSHKSIFNISSTLRQMGLKDLFDAAHADLGGLNGPSKDLYLSDMLQSTSFVTCGEGVIGEQHHMEEYPEAAASAARRRSSRWADWDEPRDYQRAFHDPHDVGEAMHLPLHLRPRQARLPARNAQPARLKFDRPFLYFVRHNPTGMILYVGRYNPRLLP